MKTSMMKFAAENERNVLHSCCDFKSGDRNGLLCVDWVTDVILVPERPLTRRWTWKAARLTHGVVWLLQPLFWTLMKRSDAKELVHPRWYGVCIFRLFIMPCRNKMDKIMRSHMRWPHVGGPGYIIHVLSVTKTSFLKSDSMTCVFYRFRHSTIAWN